MSNLVELAPQYFPKSSIGTPIGAGSLYVGDVDTNPEITANQKYVKALQENGTFVNITQPITLSAGGIPLYNGSPVSLYVNGAYSLKALDVNNSQIYYIPKNLVPLVPGNYHYPDYTETDQGVAGNGDTLKAIIDAIGGTNKATIYFRHNSGSETSDYTLTTSETTPNNTYLDFENGAIIDGTSTLTINSPEHIKASRRQQIFGSSITIAFTKGGMVFPGWWGAIADGVMATGSGTDNSDAINAAYLAAFNSGGKVYLPAGIYKILTTVGIDIDSAADQKAAPSFEGDQASQVQSNDPDANQTGTILMLNDSAGTTTALRVHNANSTSAGWMQGGELRNLKIIRVDDNGPQDKPTDSVLSIGLKTRLWADFRMYNVVIQGFYYGWYSSWCWSWDVFGISTTRNNYGIWFDRHTNAVSVNGLQGHQNNIGVRINAGYGIQLNRVTLEGQNHGIVISNNDADKGTIRSIAIRGYNSEQNQIAEILLGVDEDDATSTNLVFDIDIQNILIDNPAGNMIVMDKVESVQISGAPSTETSIITSVTSLTKYVKVLTNPGSDSVINSFEKSVDQQIGINHPYNLVPNGWTNFPSLDHIVEETGTVGWFDDSGDSLRTVVRIESSNGDANTKIGKIYIQLDERMYGQRASLKVRSKIDASVAVAISIYNSGDTFITGISSTTAWTTQGESFAIPSSGNFMYIAFAATNSSGVSKYLYYENLIITLREQASVIQSPIDVLAGLSGNTTTDANGDATVTLSARYYSARYNVIATVQEDAAVIVNIVKGDGSFAIRSEDKDGGNIGSIDIAWLVLPQTGIYGGY